ncbi:MAG TPA: Ig-like domain-containing protein [Terriglobales bacterium]|nr:Ig-like domain-containing protein [Terriglobales bacterium]
MKNNSRRETVQYMGKALRIITFILATGAMAFAGVTVSSPANGSTVSSPVHVVASASSSYPITGMKVYVDGNTAHSTSSNRIDAYIPLSTGGHYVVVKAWDSTGAVMQTSRSITVAGSSGTSGSRTFNDIEQMSGWQHCTVCAGIGANGPVAKYGMSQGRTSPSMDGNSTQFWIGGDIPYSDALWWRQLGANSTARRFVYDLYFYVKTPQYAQALEFDVNHSFNGKKYIMGTQCDIRNHRQWEVWDGIAKDWRGTGVPCSVPPAYTWNHLVEEFVHDSSGKVTFVSITLNGKKYYINRSYYSIASGANEINVAFQMDGDYAMHDYSVWLDNVKLTYW